MLQKAEPSDGTPPAGGAVARSLYVWTLVAGLLIVLAAGLPGHMTTDSVIQLAEGRTGAQRSFNPAFMSWLLGRFDSVLSGTALFVAFNVALLFGAFAALPRLTGRAHILAAPVLFLVVLSPQVLIYQGAVWKDVFFANAAIAGTLCLAFAAERWRQLRGLIVQIAGGLVLLVIAALVRQNGVLALLTAGIGLSIALLGQSGWRRSLASGLGFIAAGAAVIALASATLHRAIPQLDDATSEAGLRIIQHFDIVGALAHAPNASLKPLETKVPQAATALRSATEFYNPQRVDSLSQAVGMGDQVWLASEDVVQATWLNVVIHDFPAYASHRLEVFRQAFLTPDILACLPVTTGVQGPEAVLEELGMPSRQDRRDHELYNYATWFFGTPILSHLTFALISLAVMTALVLRGRPSDWVMAGLQAGALAFAGSFLVIALACDYRYLYFLDLAALFGLVHLALDPPWAAILRRFQK